MQSHAEPCATIQAQVSTSILNEIDAIVIDRRARNPAHKIRRADIVRELILVGLREKTRRAA